MAPSTGLHVERESASVLDTSQWRKNLRPVLERRTEPLPPPASADSTPHLLTRQSLVRTAEGAEGESDKHYLFRCDDATIVVFHLPHTDSTPQQDLGHGRMLGHGALEVYLMHYGSVTYLSCGSVIYPLLPRLRVLRVGFNQFILPLTKPERYWQITLYTLDEEVILGLGTVLESTLEFRSVYAPVDVAADRDHWRKVLDERPVLSWRLLLRPQGAVGSRPLLRVASREWRLPEPVLSRTPHELQQSDLSLITADSVSPFQQARQTAHETMVLAEARVEVRPAATAPRPPVHSSSNSSLDLLLDDFHQLMAGNVVPAAPHPVDASNDTLLMHSVLQRPSRRALEVDFRLPPRHNLYKRELAWMDLEDETEALATPFTVQPLNAENLARQTAHQPSLPAYAPPTDDSHALLFELTLNSYRLPYRAGRVSRAEPNRPALPPAPRPLKAPPPVRRPLRLLLVLAERILEAHLHRRPPHGTLPRLELLRQLLGQLLGQISLDDRLPRTHKPLSSTLNDPQPLPPYPRLLSVVLSSHTRRIPTSRSSYTLRALALGVALDLKEIFHLVLLRNNTTGVILRGEMRRAPEPSFVLRLFGLRE